MTISQRRTASIVDAIINTVVAIIWLPAFLIGMAFSGKVTLFQELIYTLIFLSPTVIFTTLALRSCLQAFYPKIGVLDRKSGEWNISGKSVGTTQSISNLIIRYTGLRSPSRYALDAVLESGHRQPLISTGYTGTREELVALSQLIGDFTNRPDLTVR